MNRNNKKLPFVFLDVFTILFSFVVAFLLRFDFDIPSEFIKLFYTWIPTFITLQLIVFYVSGFYKVMWRFTSVWDMIKIVKVITFSNLLCFTILALYQGFIGYPRSALLIFYILNVITICSTRILVRIYHSHYRQLSKRKKIVKKRLVLIGAGKAGEKITREIKNNSESPFNIVGFVDDDLSIHGESIHGIRVLGNVDFIIKMAGKYDEILITAPSANGNQLRRIINICKSTGKKYKTVPSLSELIDKDISIASIRNVSYADLLGRQEVFLDKFSIEKTIKRKRVLITGAGGSIGSELVRQCLSFNPSEIICLDQSEENIFNLENELTTLKNKTILKYSLCTVIEKRELEKIYIENRPEIVFHAAAYKHVPIQELHPWSSVKTNVKGTLNMVELSDEFNVNLFVLVSTDKAVNPVNVMGATKRVAEKIIQSYNLQSKTRYIAVRFGNVLGSSGSAIPTFEKQIEKGGPITITHPEMTRYFMSIQEASLLILQCGALESDGEIFLLEMGKPIKILQMAKDLIRLSGLEPDSEIPIVFVGLRPGEKLYEELQHLNEEKINTKHKKIMILKGKTPETWPYLYIKIKELLKYTESLNIEMINDCIMSVLPSYKPRTVEDKVQISKKNNDEIKIQA